MANINTSNFTYNEAPIRASTNQQNFISEIRPATTSTVIDPNQRPFSTLPHINSKPNVHFTTNNVPNYSSGAKFVRQETRPSIAMSSIMRSVPSPPVIGLPPQPVQISNPSVHLNYSTTSPFPYTTTTTNIPNPQLNLAPQQPPGYPTYPTYNQVTSTINHNMPVTTIGASQKIEADDRVQVKASQNQHHQWQSYYQKKPVNSRQPVPVAEEKTGNCCMIIFGILGLLALGGIIAGIILASRSHGGFGQQTGVNQGQGIFSNATSTTVLIPTNSTTTVTTANNTNSQTTTTTTTTTNTTTTNSTTTNSTTTNLNNGGNANSTSSTGTTSVSQLNSQNITVVNTNSNITKPNSTTVPSNIISSQTVNYTIAPNATSQSITYSTINTIPNQNNTINSKTNTATTTTNNTIVNTPTVYNNTNFNSTSVSTSSSIPTSTSASTSTSTSTSTPTSIPTSTSSSTSTSTSTLTSTSTSLGPAVSIKPIAQDPTQPSTTANVQPTSINTTNVATLPSITDNKPSSLISSTSLSPIAQDLQTPNSTQSSTSQPVASQTTSTLTQNQTSVSASSTPSSNSSLFQPGIKFVDPILTNSSQSSSTNNYSSTYGNGGSFSNSYIVKVAPNNVTNSSAQNHKKMQSTQILKMRHHLSRHE